MKETGTRKETKKNEKEPYYWKKRRKKTNQNNRDWTPQTRWLEDLFGIKVLDFRIVKTMVGQCCSFQSSHSSNSITHCQIADTILKKCIHGYIATHLIALQIFYDDLYQSMQKDLYQAQIRQLGRLGRPYTVVRT